MKAGPLSRVLMRMLPGRLFSSRSGQATAEYAIVAGMLVASLAILVVFLFTFKEYGGRILDFAGSEYP
ncbi:MAG: hypothetical protein WCN95_08645 [bacterium]